MIKEDGLWNCKSIRKAATFYPNYSTDVLLHNGNNSQKKSSYYYWKHNKLMDYVTSPRAEKLMQILTHLFIQVEVITVCNL